MELKERIRSILSHLSRQAKCADADWPYDSLLIRTGSLQERLLQNKSMVLHEGTDADEFTYFRFQTKQGMIDIHLCPFGPIALMSHAEGVEATQAQQVLMENGLTAASPRDLSEMSPWNGGALLDWLFPQCLSDAFTLFDCLRMQYQAESCSIQDLGTIQMANTVTLAEVQEQSVPDLLRQVARERRPLVVLLEDGETVTLEAQAALPPLPLLDGFVPEGWREAIYERD